MNRTLFLLAACVLAASATAGQKHSHGHKHDHGHQHKEQHEHRQHEAHVHGLATMNLVHEDSTVMIELQTPAMNVLGFEHKPQTPEQEQQLARAKAVLSDADNIVKLAGGNCRLQDMQLNMPEMQEDYGHADIDVHLHYACAQEAGVITLDVQLFEHFPGFEQIRLQWIVQGSQGSSVLTADRHSRRIGRD